LTGLTRKFLHEYFALQGFLLTLQDEREFQNRSNDEAQHFFSTGFVFEIALLETSL
jgi:hypothetical protein